MARMEIFEPLRTRHLLHPLFHFFDRSSHVLKILTALSLLATVVFFDYITGTDIQFFIFYAAPVSFSSWFLSRRSGMAMALLSAWIWWFINVMALTADPYIFRVSLWNTSIRLIFFVGLVIIIGETRETHYKLLKMATTDLLTQLKNRRAFYEQFDIEQSRAQREKSALSVIYLDLDNFKYVNDHWGHPVGDHLLQVLSQCIHDALRKTDVAGRLGGDEFAILLPSTPPEAAMHVAKRIQAQLNQCMQANEWPVTVSMGVASFSDIHYSPSQMLEKADQLMYQVKQEGKNKVLQKIYAGSPAP